MAKNKKQGLFRRIFGKRTLQERYIAWVAYSLIGLIASYKGCGYIKTKQEERHNFLLKLQRLEQKLKAEEWYKRDNSGFFNSYSIFPREEVYSEHLQNYASNPNTPFRYIGESDVDNKAACYRPQIYTSEIKTRNSLQSKVNKPSTKFLPSGKNSFKVSSNSSYVNKIDNEIKQILSEEFFRNALYLNEKQIKKLLESNNSCLKNTGIERTIIQASLKYGINPIYPLARLQQEQGLITKQNVSKRALKYATGYGARDDKTLPSGGLHDQVRKTVKRLNELVEEYNGIQTVKLNYGKTTLEPYNAVEYALARYTPHTEGLNLAKKVLKDINFQIKNIKN